MNTTPIVTRFAPSPTGFLHIGGARTALFNWLFARHHGGKFLLRVEDTDKARSTDEATQAILDGMKWLELDWDGDVIYQSQCADRHAEVAQQLLKSGHAYRCYCTADELTTLRDEARASGKAIRSPWRDRPTSDAPDAPHTVRIKAPESGSITIADAVQGDVTIAADQLDDFILLRADGTPTYMLAVVVDDHDMAITHIIRGDDHLNNAARQSIIYQAMGWSIPTFAHIALIHGPDGAKLSKRHGALGVDAYREMGYLPEAIRNYLLRLGWSHGDDEIISTEQAIEWFNLENINKAPARFDFDKLANLNGHYLREADDEQLVELLCHHLSRHPGGHEVSGRDPSDQPMDTGLRRYDDVKTKALLKRAIPGLKARAKTIHELANSAQFYLVAPTQPADEKATKQLTDGLPLLHNFIPILEAQNDWNHEALMALGKDFATQHDTKLGKLMAPIRVAITGSTASPSMFEVMEILGKDETLERLKSA